MKYGKNQHVPETFNLPFHKPLVQSEQAGQPLCTRPKWRFIQASSYSDTFVQESVSAKWRQQHLKSNVFCEMRQIEEKQYLYRPKRLVNRRHCLKLAP